MSRKRRNSSSVEPDSPLPRRDLDGFRQDVVEYPTGQQRPQVDASTGQAGAFPGLEDDDEELFYGPASNGIDYLRMVRSERKGIPQLLTVIQAPQQDIEDNRGHYYEGAYTALETTADIERRFPKAQDYYYDAFLTHFQTIRAGINATPPLDLIQALSSSRPISFPSESRQAKEMWERQLIEYNPHPVQIACMDIDSILQVVQLVTRKMIHFFRSDNLEYLDRLGAWIWAILGRCPDRGEMGSEEVSCLRALAQRAGDVLRWLDDRLNESQLDHIVNNEEQEPVDTSDFSRGQTAQLERDTGVDAPQMIEEAEERKVVILGAIITVVGEVYGQRDLLDLRKSWLV